MKGVWQKIVVFFKTRKWAKWVAIGLAGVTLLLFIVVPVSCSKGNGVHFGHSKGLEFELDEDNPYYIVTGIGTCTDKTIYIPEKYEGLPVKAIGRGAFKNCTSFTKVVLPDSIEEIHYEAFRSCKSLKTINLPENLKSLGANAFAVCISLKEINIPKGIERIPDLCFSQCENLTEVVIPNGVIDIGHQAFYKCSLKRVNLPNSLKYLRQYAFGYNNSLTTIKIPKNVTIIETCAFAECENLEAIYYYGSKKGLEFIAEQANSFCAFIYCS